MDEVIMCGLVALLVLHTIWIRLLQAKIKKNEEWLYEEIEWRYHSLRNNVEDLDHRTCEHDLMINVQTTEDDKRHFWCGSCGKELHGDEIPLRFNPGG